MAFLFEPKDLVPFESAWNWQRSWQRGLIKGSKTSSAVWFLQHLNCYTLGRGASKENILFALNDPPCPLYRIDRGGEVTYHCPGQLVAYPVLDLRNYQKDLDWYLRQLEEVGLDVLLKLGIKGERRPGLTGLWIEGRKVVSIGVGCRRWITQHGLSLNINCDLQGFDLIIPCGIKGNSMGTLKSWIPGIKVDDVQPLMKESFEDRFHFIFNSQDHGDL